MRRLAPVAGAIALLGLAAAPAFARDIRVSNDGSCPNADATSIQQGVDMSGPKDTVTVCPGTYAEQVSIQGPSHDGLKLRSLQPLQATIQAPPAFPAGSPNTIVLVRGSQDVRIQGFTISGPFTDPDASGCVVSARVHTGVRVDGGGDAELDFNHITHIRDANPLLGGCQDGVAVLVGHASEGQVGTASLQGNTIDDYQKNGPTVDGSGSSADIHNNTIDGGGPNTAIARNGIQISRGASASVTQNTITGNSYTGTAFPPPGDTPDDNDAVGLLLYAPASGGVLAQGNTLTGNDLGLDVGTTSSLLIAENVATNNTFDGFRAESDTSGILFRTNKASGNGTHDCHDDSHGTGTAGTANIWQNDKGTTQTPPGICRSQGNG